MVDEGEEGLALAELVNRVLDRGVSVIGDVVISVAGVDLIKLGLRLDLWAVESARQWSERSRALPPAGARPLPPAGGE